MKNLLAGKYTGKKYNTYKLSDYDDVKKKLREMAETKDLGFSKASEQAKLLLEEMPVNNIQTVYGNKEYPPSDIEAWRFLSTVELVNDPNRIFYLASKNMITERDMGTLAKFYPDFTQALTLTLVDNIAEKYSGKSFDSLGMKIDQTISKMLGITHATPDKIELLQNTFSEEEEETAESKLDIKPEMAATEVTKLANEQS